MIRVYNTGQDADGHDRKSAQDGYLHHNDYVVKEDAAPAGESVQEAWEGNGKDREASCSGVLQCTTIRALITDYIVTKR